MLKVASGVAAGLGVGAVALASLSVVAPIRVDGPGRSAQAVATGEPGAAAVPVPAAPGGEAERPPPARPAGSPPPDAVAAPAAAVADPGPATGASPAPTTAEAVRETPPAPTPAEAATAVADELAPAGAGAAAPPGAATQALGAIGPEGERGGAGEAPGGPSRRLAPSAPAEAVAPSILATAPSLTEGPVASPSDTAADPAKAPSPQASLAVPPVPARPGPAAADASPAVAVAAPEPVAAEPLPPRLPAAAPVSPQRPSLPSPERGHRGNGAPEALEVLPSDPAPAPVAGAPSRPPSAAEPPQPVSPLPAQARAGDLPAPDASPLPPPAVAPVRGAPPPDALALDTEPAEPTPARPERIALEGGGLPGSASVLVRRPEAEAAGPASEAAPPPAEPPPAEPLAVDAPALLRHAAAFTPPEAPRPLLSLVLLDEGALADAPATVAALPFAVSVALDPTGPDAAGRMASYRAAGIEVLALARLPAGARPQDVEVFLGGALDLLPEAVAVLDLGEGGLRGRDATAAMALSRLARDGLGAVLAEGGLGRGAEAAEAAGVPAAEILRDLDGAGQDEAAIRRALDDAVRRAAQEGEAVVLGRLGAGTLAAVGAWSREGRAREVTVAPVSAVLAPPGDP